MILRTSIFRGLVRAALAASLCAAWAVGRAEPSDDRAAAKQSPLEYVKVFVPADRIEACCQQLGRALTLAKLMCSLITETARAQGADVPPDGGLLPKGDRPWVWIDDGETETRMGMYRPDGHKMGEWAMGDEGLRYEENKEAHP